MKRLLLTPLLLALLLVSCSNNKKYNSYREAKDACEKWAAKGGTYELKNPAVTSGKQPYTFKYILREVVYQMPLRWCDEEGITNQVLGLRIPERKKGEKRIYTKRCEQTYLSKDNCDEISNWQKENSKVKANFYY